MTAAIMILAALMAAEVPVEGVVRDSSGAVVSGASVIARPTGTGAEVRTTTGSDGRFSLNAPTDSFDLYVRAGGFAESITRFRPEDPPKAVPVTLDIELTPATLLEELTVRENVELPIRLSHAGRKRFVSRIAQLLAYLGLRKVKRVGPPKRAIKQAQETKVALTSRS